LNVYRFLLSVASLEEMLEKKYGQVENIENQWQQIRKSAPRKIAGPWNVELERFLAYSDFDIALKAAILNRSKRVDQADSPQCMSGLGADPLTRAVVNGLLESSWEFSDVQNIKIEDKNDQSRLARDIVLPLLQQTLATLEEDRAYHVQTMHRLTSPRSYREEQPACSPDESLRPSQEELEVLFHIFERSNLADRLGFERSDLIAGHGWRGALAWSIFSQLERDLIIEAGNATIERNNARSWTSRVQRSIDEIRTVLLRMFSGALDTLRRGESNEDIELLWQGLGFALSLKEEILLKGAWEQRLHKFASRLQSLVQAVTKYRRTINQISERAQSMHRRIEQLHAESRRLQQPVRFESHEVPIPPISTSSLRESGSRGTPRIPSAALNEQCHGDSCAARGVEATEWTRWYRERERWREQENGRARVAVERRIAACNCVINQDPHCSQTAQPPRGLGPQDEKPPTR
jgi:hypothetical protein